MELILEAKAALLGTIVAYLVTQNSLRNLTYGDICRCVNVNLGEGLPDLFNMVLVLLPLQHVGEGNCRFLEL